MHSWRESLRPDLEHRRPGDRIILQRVQSLVGFAEWKHLHSRADRDLGREAEKILTVMARIVRDAAHDTFRIEQIVVERRNWAHVDPAQNQSPALAKGLQRGGNNLTSRRKNDGGIAVFGWLCQCC